MRILADDNIADVAAAFAHLGRVRTVPSHDITHHALADVDVLLSRSTIQVGPGLLAGTPVRFYATATSGTDHVDLPWLEQAGIGFASAHGSNARAVAEWFVGALDRAGFGLDWAGLRVGVVGVGAVGSQVADLARRLGAAVACSDPPRERAGHRVPHGERWVGLDEAVAGSDIVTFHVPLTHAGPDATAGFVSAQVLGQLGPDAVFVNASRGDIVATDDLLARPRRLLLDVFAGEPNFDPRLVAAAELATPHVAGHSLEGKLLGTEMIAAAAQRFVEVGGDPWVASPTAPEPLHVGSASEAVQARCMLTSSDAALRELATLPDGERGRAFRAFRRRFVHRREFHAGHIVHADPNGILTQLGFTVLAPPDAG